MVTVITKTIGPTGRDYATFTLAEAAVESIATAEFGSTDLVANDGAIVFEADAATYSESVTFQSSLTTDATRQVTYKAAAGSEHGGLLTQGVRIDGITVTRDSFTVLDALVLYRTAAAGTHRAENGEGITYRSVIANTGSGGEPFQALNVVSVRYENCVAHTTPGSGKGWRLDVVTRSGAIDLVNCTDMNPYRSIFLTVSNGYDAQVNIVNFLSLSPRGIYVLATGGSTYTLTGSNNVGGATGPFPAALQGSPYPITATTSFSTPLGSGDYAVYMGATGALANVTGNDVWQQGVGPGSNSDVPTTDINGVARSGATCNPGAFEADGFVAPTITTQTIGPVGRDFATFTLAEASLPAEDITFTNRAFVFEADAATYNESVTFSSSLTTDATRQVTYKPAAGSEHGGIPGAGVRIQFGNISISSVCIDVNDDFVTIDKLELDWTDTSGTGRALDAQVAGLLVRDCILRHAGTGALVQATKSRTADSATYPMAFQNCVLDGNGHGFRLWNYGTSDKGYTVTNCTITCAFRAFDIYSNTDDTTYTITNNLILAAAEDFRDQGGGGTSTVLGSNNFGPQSNPTHVFPAALKGSPYPVTPSTAYDPGAGDFALYVSSTGQLLDSPHNDVIGGGVGPAANADVPTTDIVGRARTGSTANPGAFALAQATRVIGKTIGPVGRDYATFTLAESAVESIATAETGSTDLVAGNARIEFLADAGTYSESVIIDNALTCDPTRNVTFQSATFDIAHIETDAFFGVVQIRDGAFTTLRRLKVTNTNTGAACRGVEIIPASGDSCEGCTLDGLTSTGANSANFTAFEVELNTSAAAGGAGSAAHPSVIQNCVALGTGTGIGIVGGATGEIHARIVNCTLAGTGLAAISIQTPSDVTVEVVNTINLSHTQTFRTLFTTGALTTSGSNNFGNTTQPFPAALQGSPYPITATTNTDPGPGHFAIYDADTGALVNVAANTVWQRGVGPSVNSDVPTTGIAGFPRSGATANPGAFAASTALAATTNPVARFFTYKRPSTQVFNHHRRITCLFPDDGPSGNGNTFAVGVAARGFISPISRDCVAFFVYYTTDGAGVQTSLRLEVARLLGPYSQDTIAEAQPIAVIEKQAVGEAIPAGFNFPGQSHTVAFKVQTFSGATTPESAAEYTAFIDGTAVTFDTFYQSSTQDGTTKVVTHPAPAVGTTQGRAEAFFWYATADRVDSSGSENYSLPQWSAWTQLAVDPDPLFDGDGETVAVLGEGTGTVNLSTAVEHVDWNLSIQYELPRFDVPFASGHRYTSPRFENARRLITASATNVDKATMDLIVQFHSARKGIEDPFLFNFPIPATMASETYTVITVQFADQNGMVYRREAENTYSVQLNLIELL